ncbi:family 43 glycosylhydrolase [Herbiconiux ginsengi]|uniref:family 43 glycosylhydrolase n=1 Tax=Herbiconiux ginsengi TaxID=381665 RepID=UPI00268B0D2B|nr:family 43 glycosylhydrolase [Herbiconiux ginsengi]
MMMDQVYLYFGFAPNNPITSRVADKHKLEHKGAYVVALEDDMTTISAGPRLIVPMAGTSEGTGFEGHEFFEASSIRKIGDTYYFVYSSIHGHELCYATSSHPAEGYRFAGVLISNGDIGLDGRAPKDALNYTSNNHGGLVEIAGQWYIFYHRHTHRDQVSRQAAAEPIDIDENGRFTQAEMTSSGLHNGPLPGVGKYAARIACVLQSAAGAKPVPYLSLFRSHSAHPYFTQTGRDREGNGDQYIANLRDGAVAGFKYFDLKDTRSIEIDTRGGSGDLQISTELNGVPLASVRVSDSSGRSLAELPPGLSESSALYFRYRGKGAVDFHAFTLG